jgi:hypothetical protein
MSYVREAIESLGKFVSSNTSITVRTWECCRWPVRGVI